MPSFHGGYVGPLPKSVHGQLSPWAQVTGAATEFARLGSEIGLAVIPELGSFQVELNPGPWPMTEAGSIAGLEQLRFDVAALECLAQERGLILSTAGFLPHITQELLDDSAFFTRLNRYEASSRYFQDNVAHLKLVDGTTLTFPGETAVACINELHINVQLGDDESTIRLYNSLNGGGIALARQLLHVNLVNGMAFEPGQSTISLFEQANTDYNTGGNLNRVGFVLRPIASYQDYLGILSSFDPIPLEDGYLPLESTVYFWVRLRGKPGSLRIEYRPPEMSATWDRTILKFLADVHEIGSLP